MGEFNQCVIFIPNMATGAEAGESQATTSHVV